MPAPGPTNLYAYTDSSATGTPYYGWGLYPNNESAVNQRAFTASTTLSVGDTVYYFVNDNSRASYDISQATETTIYAQEEGCPVQGFWLDGTTLKFKSTSIVSVDFIRNQIVDINRPQTVYTDTNILDYGMTVYNDNGTAITKAGPVVNGNFYINQPLYGFYDKGSYDRITPNHTNILVYALSPTPSNGDLAFDKNGDLIEGVYFTDSTHIYDPDSLTSTYIWEMHSFADTLIYRPFENDWTLNVTVTGDFSANGSLQAVNSTNSNPAALLEPYNLFTLPLVERTPANWYPEIVGSAVVSLHKSINRVKIVASTYSNDPILSVSNCNVIQETNSYMIIEPINKALPVSISYNGNY